MGDGMGEGRGGQTLYQKLTADRDTRSSATFGSIPVLEIGLAG